MSKSGILCGDNGVCEAFYLLINGNKKIFVQDVLSSSGPHSKILAVYFLVNQATGDAISNLLLVEAALQILGWDTNKWALLYTDLPSSMLKVIFLYIHYMPNLSFLEAIIPTT